MRSKRLFQIIFIQFERIGTDSKVVVPLRFLFYLFFSPQRYRRKERKKEGALTYTICNRKRNSRDLQIKKKRKEKEESGEESINSICLYIK